MTQQNLKIEWKNFKVAQGLLIYNNKVLLVGNDYGLPELVWSLPGGRLEAGEQHHEALVREFQEETGLDVVVQDLLYVMEARTYRDNRTYSTMVFEVALTKEYNSLPEVSTGDDLAVKALHWANFEETPGLLKSPSLGEGLVNFLYYGKENMPRRYWFYGEYWQNNAQSLSWPPAKR